MSWEEYRGEVARSMIQIGGKMMDIGKTSTFCGLFAIWVVNEKTKEKVEKREKRKEKKEKRKKRKEKREKRKKN